MSLIRWTPMWDPFEEMDEVMSRLPAVQGGQGLQKAFVPAMDIYQTDKAVVLETPLAGVKPEDVTVTVEKGVLTVQGQSSKEHEVDEKNYYRKEVRSGSFFRQVALPVLVTEDKVSAEFENGILKVTCPKAQPTQAKKVSVKVVKKENGKK
ncbi:MAG TPA: Hsp20/alpha crystallin family protein [Patescibacteria group bacterium]|nr:Hsp20/alpha crystallin family protein [Patescibacteria group bacterium]